MKGGGGLIVKLIKTQIDEVFAVSCPVFKDDRGHFIQSFQESQFNEIFVDVFSDISKKTGKSAPAGIKFIQDNESFSRAGVIRGLHYQLYPFAQSKLVRVLFGEILDVALDLRKGSPSFGEYVSMRLSATSGTALFVPRGFAHGFVALEDSVVAYKVDAYYAPQSESGISYNSIDLDWGVKKPILSEKDILLPDFSEDLSEFDYRFDYYA